MEFHAWMNPYRITTSGVDLSALSADNMARQHPDWILTYNNAMYYNPAKEEVKQYITDTVAEVVENYDVDAVHFDDYFYPSNYPLPEGEGREGSAANERREHVNDLIEMVSKRIKSIDSSVEFGISPMGIWKNSSSDPVSYTHLDVYKRQVYPQHIQTCTHHERIGFANVISFFSCYHFDGFHECTASGNDTLFCRTS